MNEEELRVDTSALPTLDDMADAFDADKEEEEQQLQRNLVAKNERQQYEAVREDPRNVEKGIGGFAGVSKEIGSAIGGGLQDTASSVTTFTERTVDALSGARQREIEETG